MSLQIGWAKEYLPRLVKKTFFKKKATKNNGGENANARLIGDDNEIDLDLEQRSLLKIRAQCFGCSVLHDHDHICQTRKNIKKERKSAAHSLSFRLVLPPTFKAMPLQCFQRICHHGHVTHREHRFGHL
jgi:hypothetical protein